MVKPNHDSQLEELIDIDDSSLSLKTIDEIANDDNVRTRYERRYQNRLYSTIFKSLTHEIFSESEATQLWKEVVNHRCELNHILDRDVGIAVSSMDYLLNIKDKLSDPKIIEEERIISVTETTMRDDLTGLFIRDVFDILLKQEINRANREGTKLCLLMMDIDDFKQINDNKGHLKGDEVLSKIGNLISQTVRSMDLAARYGGEEVAIIMPNTQINYAFNAGERIRRSIEKLEFDDFKVTVSIGISEFKSSTDTPSKLIKAADDALYRAKEAGKNRIETADIADNRRSR